MAPSVFLSPAPFLIKNFGNTGNGGRGRKNWWIGIPLPPVSELHSIRRIKGGEFSHRCLTFGEFLRTLRAHLELFIMIEMSMINVAVTATEVIMMTSIKDLYISELDALMDELNAIRQQPESLRQELLNQISQMLTHYSPKTDGESLYVDEIVVSWLECYVSSLCSSLSKDIKRKKFFSRRKNSGQRRYHAALKSLRALRNDR